MASDDVSRQDMTGLVGGLTTLLLSTANVESFLDDLARLACQVVDPTPSCGITTRYDHQPITIASSDPRAEKIDQEQYVADDGPCLSAMRTGVVSEIVDQSTDQRWPQYRVAALEQGVLWVLSLPLSVDSHTMGALNIYGYDLPNALRGLQRRRLETFAAQAAAALMLAVRNTKQRELSEHLEQALTSRSVIDQAIGVLMAQQRCSADIAFELLRRHSQNSNRKLREVAAEVISRFSGQDPGSPPAFEPPRPSKP